MKEIKFAYFGGEPLGVPALEELKTAGLLPSLVVTSPDRPVGRKQVMTPPPTKVWALEHGIEVFQPESCKKREELGRLVDEEWDLFVVVAYNHILPKWLIDLPKHQTINMHPSLLPSLRGPSPIRTAILEDRREDVGASVMLMDEKMDHGPILDQIHMPISDENWPMPGLELDSALARLGGSLLSATIPEWVAGNIAPQEQAHEMATYTKKFTREDGKLEIDPHNLPTSEEAFTTYLKICAFEGFPETYFEHQGKRVKIKEAELSTKGQLRLHTVVPEGKPAMPFKQWLSSL